MPGMGVSANTRLAQGRIRNRTRDHRAFMLEFLQWSDELWQADRQRQECGQVAGCSSPTPPGRQLMIKVPEVSAVLLSVSLWQTPCPEPMRCPLFRNTDIKGNWPVSEAGSGQVSINWQPVPPWGLSGQFTSGQPPVASVQFLHSKPWNQAGTRVRPVRGEIHRMKLHDPPAGPPDCSGVRFEQADGGPAF